VDATSEDERFVRRLQNLGGRLSSPAVDDHDGRLQPMRRCTLGKWDRIVNRSDEVRFASEYRQSMVRIQHYGRTDVRDKVPESKQ
jgi:hypothetical protein